MRTRRSSKSPTTASSATSSKSCPPSPKPWKKRKPHNLLQFQSRSLCYNESKSMTVQREQLEADVLIVGAGPAGLACALHLANLIKKHNESGAAGGPALSAENIYVLEKGREIGAHQLSGAIMNPKALPEIVPEFEKNGKAKGNYTPGYELRAKVTVLAEGPRGSLTKQLVQKNKLDNINPQIYSIGVKELWDVQPGRIQPGYVAHTLGWPVPTDMYGGGWIYGLTNNRVSIGLVIGLEYSDPQFDPHEAFQIWKTHPFIKNILEGGKLVRYGAKTIPAGGWYSMPRPYVDGGLIIGDSASFLDSQRLKGIHMAIKSGMLAAETIFEALKAGDTSAAKLSAFQKKVEESYIKKELRLVRNFHQSFQYGLFGGLFHAGMQFISGGRGLIDPMRVRPGYEHYHKNGHPPRERFKGDGRLTFDRLTDVYHSGTRHEEDQPCHLIVRDLNVCANRCTVEYGNPCQYFCPAAVYEPVQEKDGFKLKINAANCVH